MIVIAAVVCGGALGALRARRRGGGRLDMAQYAAAHAIAFGIAGLFLTLLLDRLL